MRRLGRRYIFSHDAVGVRCCGLAAQETVPIGGGPHYPARERIRGHSARTRRREDRMNLEYQAGWTPPGVATAEKNLGCRVKSGLKGRYKTLGDTARTGRSTGRDGVRARLVCARRPEDALNPCGPFPRRLRE